MTNLTKTIAVLAATTTAGLAHADSFTDALNLDNPSIGNLTANYNEQAPSVKESVIKGAVEFISQNESSVKSGKISAQEYAKQTAQKLLTVGDPTIEIVPAKIAQACLTVYGSQLMQQANANIKSINQMELSMRELARQIKGGENPDMAHNLTSDLGVNLINHDVTTNLTSGQLQVAKACFEMTTLLNGNAKGQGVQLVQNDGAEGLEILKNYENPYDFTDEQAKEIIDTTPSLQQIKAGSMEKADRDNAIKEYILRENGAERAAAYLTGYDKVYENFAETYNPKRYTAEEELAPTKYIKAPTKHVQGPLPRPSGLKSGR